MIRFPLILAAHLSIVLVGDVAPLPSPKPEPWKELVCDVGSPVVLSAGDGSKGVSWKLIDDATGASLTTVPDSSHAVFFAARPGRYKFASIADGKPSWCVMVAGDAPGPGPTPPPKPVDDLTKLLQAAYTADPGATKAQDLKQLIALYAQCAEFAMSTSVSTAGELREAVSKAATTLLPDDPETGRRLAGLRKAISTELASVLPADAEAPLTEAVRSAASAAFGKYAKALAGVTP